MRKSTHGRPSVSDPVFEAFLRGTTLSDVEKEIARCTYYLSYRIQKKLGPTTEEQWARGRCAVDRFCRRLLRKDPS